jgi:hypothetical protein
LASSFLMIGFALKTMEYKETHNGSRPCCRKPATLCTHAPQIPCNDISRHETMEHDGASQYATKTRVRLNNSPFARIIMKATRNLECFISCPRRLHCCACGRSDLTPLRLYGTGGGGGVSRLSAEAFPIGSVHRKSRAPCRSNDSFSFG